jgi:FixJ family two-component response regulator
MAERSLCAVVDDELVRESLPDLLREFGFAARAFASGEKLMASGCVGAEHCLILDIAMPGTSGMDVQSKLLRRRRVVPLVSMTRHGDKALRPRILKQGAAECLFRPFSDSALLGAIQAALHVK